MLIDWFTVAAQVVNFLILVWLLKRFLYRPILNAIDAREQRIAKELADADAKKAEAQQERDTYQHKNEEFDKQRATHLQQVLDEVKVERQRLLDTARQESDELRSKQQEALRSEQRSLSEAITQRARDEVFAIARKTLTDLAGTTLEARMIEIFLQRLQTLDATEMTALQSAFGASTKPLLVRSTFDLSTQQRTAIETTLKEILGKQHQVQFETAADLVSGIEMSANGQKLAWSIADYLASLAKSIDALLKTPSNLQAKTEIVNPAKTKQSSDANNT